MSRLMKYEIRSVDEGIHHVSVDVQSEELERVDAERDEEDNANEIHGHTIYLFHIFQAFLYILHFYNISI